MNGNMIDSVTAGDVTKLTFSDLRVKYGTGRRSLVSGSGRNKVHKYRIGCMTEIGDIREDVWVQLAEQLVKQTGEEHMLDLLIQETKSIPYMKREPASAIRAKALESHMSRLFDNPAWVGFIPFNEPWRPEALEFAEIINIIPECCPRPGRITLAQIHRCNGEEAAYCPHCGRHSPFQRTSV